MGEAHTSLRETHFGTGERAKTTRSVAANVFLCINRFIVTTV
jgi:hypothetical protein